MVLSTLSTLSLPTPKASLESKSQELVVEKASMVLACKKHVDKYPDSDCSIVDCVPVLGEYTGKPPVAFSVGIEVRGKNRSPTKH